MSKDKTTKLEVHLNPIWIKRDIKPNCTNSVYLETKNLKMLCVLNGPKYTPQRTNDDSKMDISFTLKIPAYCTNTLKTSLYESQLFDVFYKHFIIEKYPRTKLDITIEIFEFNWDFFPYAVMASSLCACYANIEQKGILTCCNIIFDNCDDIIVDPSIEEESGCKGKMVVGCNLAMKENFMFMQNGKFENTVLQKGLATAIKICEMYHQFLLGQC